MKGADRQPPRPKWTTSCFYSRAPSLPGLALLVVSILSLQFLLSGSAVASEDVRSLFEQAGQLKEAGACEEAEPLYASVAEDPGAEELKYPALYNRAVCLEMLRRYDEAMADYSVIVDSRADRPLVRDALFRIGMIESLQADYTGARLRFRGLLRGSSGPAERARIRIQLGDLEMQSGHPHRAAFQLRRAQRLLAAGSGPTEPWFAAQQQVVLGDLFSHAASRIMLKPRSPRCLVRLLERRGALLERAQRHYVAAIELHQPTWMQGATLRLGRSLLAMSREMASLEQRLADDPQTPTRVDSNHLAAWLGKQRPAMARKAHESFRLCLDVSTETGAVTRFGPACAAALDHFPMHLLPGPDAAP